MSLFRKKRRFRSAIETWKQKKLSSLERRLQHKKRVADLKADLQKSSHSLLWVWEFSKKAVLICFIFYAVIQIYSMFVMYYYQDFSYLGELITGAVEVLTTCVFGYFVKALGENAIDKWFGHKRSDDDSVG